MPVDRSVTIVSLNVQTLDILTALVILGGAALFVAVAILVGQRLEGRAGGVAALPFSIGDERLATAEDRLEAVAFERDANDDALRRANVACARSLFVMDDSPATTTVQPWRAASARDLSGLSGHRHASSHEWCEAESDGLVELYRVGFLLEELAEEFDVEPCSIVEELARRVFGAIEPVADPLARRFGQTWTAAELRTLHSAARSGLLAPEIARQLGRDQLSVVFRLLEAAADARGHRSEPAFDPIREVALHA